MATTVLTARRGHGPAVEGEALVSAESIHFLMDVDPQTGVCVRQGHPLEGQNLAGRVLVFPYGKGGVANFPGVPALADAGTAPAGLMYYATKPDLVHAAIGGRIAIMDGFAQNPVEAISTGDYVRMDPAFRRAEVWRGGSPPGRRRRRQAARRESVPAGMRLTREEERMLSGQEGEAARWAMDFLVQEAAFWQAPGTARLFSAHVGACVAHMGYRDWGIRLVERLAAQGARFRALTTTTPVSVDSDAWQEMGVEKEAAEKQMRLSNLLVQMGAAPTETTSPYLLGNVPHLGDHIAWGESNEVAFANAYFGARGNLLSYLGVIAHAITGRIPVYGFGLQEDRRGNVLVEVQASMRHETDWEALGFVVNRTLRRYDAVPVFVDLPQERADIHTLKRLSCTLSTVNPWGALGMFHAVGVTAEAPTVEAACGGAAPRERIAITQKDIQSVYDFYGYEGRIDHVFLGDSATPWEMAEIAGLFAGKKVARGVNVWVFTDHAWKPVAERMGVLSALRKAGCRIIAGVFPSAFGGSKIRDALDESVIVCDRAAAAYWFTGSTSWMGRMRTTPVFRPVAECVRAAVTGRL